MARVARTLQKKSDLALDWFGVGGAISSDAVEGLNNKLEVVLRRSHGFRTEEGLSVAQHHASASTRGAATSRCVPLTCLQR